MERHLDAAGALGHIVWFTLLKARVAYYGRALIILIDSAAACGRGTALEAAIFYLRGRPYAGKPAAASLAYAALKNRIVQRIRGRCKARPTAVIAGGALIEGAIYYRRFGIEGMQAAAASVLRHTIFEQTALE